MGLQRVAVFCGSNVGDSNAYRNAAPALGKALAADGLSVVFGGTNKGLMEALAAGASEAGGTIHGVITRGLADRGQACRYSTELEVVETRSERKLRMSELADAFVALPGGIGTLEELFEVWVNAQFEGHTKPMGLLNTEGYFAHLMAFIDEMVKRAFLPAAQRQMVIVESDPHDLIARMRRFEPVTVSKWL